MAKERRAHARIAVPLSARLVVGGEEVEYAVRDVSRGGIFLYTPEPPGKVGATFNLKLALTAGIKPLTLQTKIIRVVSEPREKGVAVVGIALSFLKMTAEQESALVDLLDRAMLGPGTNSRAYPRVYHLLEVVCRTKSEFRVVLQDIGEGGLGLFVDRAFPINEEVTVEVSKNGNSPLKLQGWVVSSEAVEGEVNRFRLGVRFARLSPEGRKELQSFIKRLYRG